MEFIAENGGGVGIGKHMTLQTILAGFGVVGITGATLVSISFALFRLFGEKWINSKFEQRIASYKHEQNKEIERLRYKINTLFDRATKLHSREFEVISEAWGLAWDAYKSATILTSIVQKTPELNGVSEEAVEELLENSKLTERQKKDVRNASDKTAKFLEESYFHRRNENRIIYQSFRDFLKKNGIFIPPELRAKFKNLEDVIYEAFSEHEYNKENKIVPEERYKIDVLRKDGERLLSDLEKDVAERVWSYDKSEF